MNLLDLTKAVNEVYVSKGPYTLCDFGLSLTMSHYDVLGHKSMMVVVFVWAHFQNTADKLYKLMACFCLHFFSFYIINAMIH